MKRLKNRIAILLGACILLLFLFLTQRHPTHNREWADEFEHLPTVTTLGDAVTIENVRNWRYEGETITSREWISRTIPTSDINRVWFVVEPFTGWDGIAHTLFVFDIKGDSPIAFSVEARKEKGEAFNPVAGIFREYELIYQWGSEVDFLTRRAVQLDHEVTMYPLRISEESAELLFNALVKETNAISAEPRWFNTLTSNCTNNLAHVVNNIKPGTIPLHYARVLTGYADEFLYTRGFIDTDLTFEAAEEKYKVTEMIKELNGDEDFSMKLREYLE